jgi:hypothetical protein
MENRTKNSQIGMLLRIGSAYQNHAFKSAQTVNQVNAELLIHFSNRRRIERM